MLSRQFYTRSHLRKFFSDVPLRSSLIQKYDQMIFDRKVRNNPSQRIVLEHFNQLLLNQHRRKAFTFNLIEKIASLWSKYGASGTYLYGSVGCGKTLLMDMLYEDWPDVSKQRFHYNSFMHTVHQTIYRIRKDRKNLQSYQLYESLLDEAFGGANRGHLLCLDEFQVVDIADAMILRCLLDALFRRGIYLLTTSNRHPDDLYLNGIQRASFLPAIQMIKDKMDIFKVDSTEDYRRAAISQGENQLGDHKVFFSPINSTTCVSIERTIELILGFKPTFASTEIPVGQYGRWLSIKKASLPNIAQFTFAELCKAKGFSSADFIAIADAFKMIVVTAIPRFRGWEMREEARQWMTLVDILYDRHCLLIGQFEVCPIRGGLFGGLDIRRLSDAYKSLETNEFLRDDETRDALGALQSSSLFTGAEEAFAAERTISRLHEMSTISWLFKCRKFRNW